MQDPLGPGIQFWKSGQFFEAHEAWERPWLEATGLDKRLLGGLIQAAGAFHLRDRRPEAADRLLQAAWKKCFEGQIEWTQLADAQDSSMAEWWTLHRVEISLILKQMEALQSKEGKATLKK